MQLGPAQLNYYTYTRYCMGAGVSPFHETRCLCMRRLWTSLGKFGKTGNYMHNASLE